MTTHPLPNPKRCRQIPPQFSWIDHRLVRHHYFERCSSNSLALYLFLLTVADARGLSYYSHASLLKQLKFSTLRFTQARMELIKVGLIAYQHPLYQVLSIEEPTPAAQITTSRSKEQFKGVKQLLATLGENND